MAGEGEVVGHAGLGDHGPEIGDIQCRRLVAAAEDLSLASAMIVGGVGHAADESEPVHLQRRVGEELGDVEAGDACRNRPEGATRGCPRLRVPGLELADATMEEDLEDALPRALHRLGQRRPAHEAGGRRRRHATEEGAAREDVIGRAAGGIGVG